MAYMPIFPEWAHFPTWNRFEGVPFTGKKKSTYSSMVNGEHSERFRQGFLMKTPQPGLGEYNFKKAMMINPVRANPARLNTKGFASRAKLVKLNKIGIIPYGQSGGKLPGYVTSITEIAGFDELGLGATRINKSFGGRTPFGMMQHKLNMRPTKTGVFRRIKR